MKLQRHCIRHRLTEGPEGKKGERMKAKGNAPKQIICAAMQKLLHIVYGVIKSQKPFAPASRLRDADQDGVYLPGITATTKCHGGSTLQCWWGPCRNAARRYWLDHSSGESPLPVNTTRRGRIGKPGSSTPPTKTGARLSGIGLENQGLSDRKVVIGISLT